VAPLEPGDDLPDAAQVHDCRAVGPEEVRWIQSGLQFSQRAPDPEGLVPRVYEDSFPFDTDPVYLIHFKHADAFAFSISGTSRRAKPSSGLPSSSRSSSNASRARRIAFLNRSLLKGLSK